MTANRNQVRIPSADVTKIVEQCSIIESRVVSPQAAALTARMVSSFGYILKCSGEAAVADASFSDPTFARGLATDRVKIAAVAEVWAHEGWHMMKVMNMPEDVVAPTIAHAIHSTLPHLIEVNINSVEALMEPAACIIYHIASGRVIDIDMLLDMGDFHARPEFKHDADDLQRVANILTDLCKGIIEGVSRQFEGSLLAYWNVAKYRFVPSASDLHQAATQSAWCPAVSLMVSSIIDDIHRRFPDGRTAAYLNAYPKHAPHFIAENVAHLLLVAGGEFASRRRINRVYDRLLTTHGLQNIAKSEPSEMAAEIASAFEEELAACNNYTRPDLLESVLAGV